MSLASESEMRTCTFMQRGEVLGGACTSIRTKW